MNPITHFLIGWTLAGSVTLDRRERAIVTVSGVIPDIDGIGIIAEKLTQNWDTPLRWWSDYHHLLTHNIGFAVFVAIAACFLARQKLRCSILAFISVHLHLAGDIIGARGPDGYQWPIPYLLPFSDSCSLSWQGQWKLNAWPNILITSLALAWAFYMAHKRGISPLEMVSARANKAFVKTLRNRFTKNR
ncbi:metal-dependent hydrolase [Desulfobacterales bacterium HSG16]|nr:metal-dependent hydrolase [Desulfobacterales bacterium HSG16]